MARSADAHAEVIHQVNAALEGAVADVLAQLVPEVRNIPRRRVLETIFDDIALLERCFTAFRDNPERFRHLLVDQHKVPVKTAEELLRCGRSLDDVVAMVVRTAAKRHFRRRLDGDSRPLKGGRRAARAEASLFSRLLALVATPKPVKPVKSRGRVLYEAFQDNLRHDWQVPLVPEYATLSPALVRRLGSRILDYHAAADIRSLKDNPENPPVPTPVEIKPLFQPAAAAAPPPAETGPVIGKANAPGSSPFSPPPLPRLTASGEKGNWDQRARLEDVLTADGRRLKPSAFTAALLDPQVREVLPDGSATAHIAQVLSSVGAIPTKMLIGELGLRADQLAVLLIAANAALGDTRFGEVFGNPGKADVLVNLIARGRAAGIDQSTPVKVIAALARTSFPAKRPPLGPT